jgi:pyruvate, water dikinase
MPYILPFEQLSLGDLAEVGGKNASLGELTRELPAAGVVVPRGFALTAGAFREHLLEAGLAHYVYESLDALDVSNVSELARVSKAIRHLIRQAPLPKAAGSELLLAYQELSRSYGETETDVAVRSSATAEDLPTASFAGQQESYLNVRGAASLFDAVRDCMASLFTDRAIAYRAERGFDHRKVALSVGVQKMVRSDLGSAGVVFTLDTESGSRDVVIITSSWGLGENVVKGRVNPDELWVHKPTLDRGFEPIIRRELGDKATTLVYGEGGNTTVQQDTDPERAQSFSISDAEVLTLSRWALAIERHYSSKAGKPTPMDIEWARDGRTGQLFIVQARPETVHAQRTARLELFHIGQKGQVLARGKSVGSKIGVGKVRVIRDVSELPGFQQGEVLVAPMTDPDWEPVLRRAAAIVTDQGGRTCHAAIISRELGIPCVAGTHDASSRLSTGQLVTVSCAEGDEGRVYEGELSFERRELDPAALPAPSVPVMLNVATPETAFQLGQLPSSGVGLLRVEFVVGSRIGIHPMALVHPERVAAEDLAAIRARVGTSREPARYFVERMAEGVGQIAAAFYPRDVIVRFSDFKTNEYARLLGGASFEPHEENPMIGFRGASRYYHERYREGFALECEALRRVRDVMGLRNVKLMIPFCRTLDEAHQVLDELAQNGLRRGDHGLEIYVMCEVPSNVVLADDFAELFDGFSIGSNDLTQLTLGIDRDSATLAPLFNESDPAVLRSIEHVVEAAHRHGRKVGICGQAPSDHPELARFLADIGIDSISVTSDALPAVCEVLAIGRHQAHPDAAE